MMNLGAQKLRLCIEARGKQQALAKHLGVDAAVVLRWAHRGQDGRHTKPSAPNRARLNELLGIGFLDWEAPESESVDPETLNLAFDEPDTIVDGAA